MQHARDSGFEQGLRQYFEYRNLGYHDATGGRFGVNVIRAIPGEHPHGKWHVHELDFQFVYVLKGWVEFSTRTSASCAWKPTTRSCSRHA